MGVGFTCTEMLPSQMRDTEKRKGEDGEERGGEKEREGGRERVA